MSSPGGYLYGPDEVAILNACDTARPAVMPVMSTEEYDALKARFEHECARTVGVPDSVLNHKPTVKS